MAKVNMCEASGAMLPDGDEQTAPWGWPRTYSREAMVAVDAYTRAVAGAAIEARKVFRALRQEAKDEFRGLYPEGKLPDEADEP